MNKHGDGRRDPRRTGRRVGPEDRIQDAVARIEQAARDLSASATDRAADYIEGVADRISPDTESRHESGGERAAAWPWSGRPRTARFCRDRENGKLLGVCAGIANYYGLETWVVRCIALTGLVFLTSVTVVGYFIAAFIMDPSPARTRRLPRLRRRPPKRHGQERRSDQDEAWREEPYAWIPGQRLRDVRADFDQMELRLRRMEAHVTSGHYELHRELAELEKRDPDAAETNRSG